MGIEFSWDEEDSSLLVMRYQKPWTWQDFDAAAVQLEWLLGQKTENIYLVIDVRQAGYPPKGAIKRFKSVTDRDMPQIGGVIFIAPYAIATLINLMSETLSSIYRQKYHEKHFHMVNTPEQARALVTSLRASVSPQK